MTNEEAGAAMYVTIDDYKELGYTAVPDMQFARYQMRAEAAVRRYTQDRIRDPTEQNKRGVCEVMDLYYLGDNPNSDEARAKLPIVSFKNQGYSETRLGSDRGDQKAATPTQMTVADVMALYFTPEQLYRGIG